MAAELRFETMAMKTGNFGTESCVPSFLGNMTFQNEVEFALDEWDEIYEAYGRCASCYPYREINTYNRTLQDVKVNIAVLENDYLEAVFLPDFGGRLWVLKDKKTGRDLLYTNDVLRYSNLAVRNAWFSGGVEWNIGIIGHTPMSTEHMHTAKLINDAGEPVLRMYNYERIRGLEYQIDFWLGEQDRFLNCRMRVVNSGKEVVPMYWWSNMAVPEYDDGRIAVPTDEAFTCGYIGENNQVYKTQIPMVGGIDVSKYKDIPYQVDYFFNIAKSTPKYIANLDAEGYGLLHMSTDRLRGRKLFSWGNNDGSDRWQEFLTEDAGRYVEIQAGLAQTQYGCLPLAPHTAWEWMEQYGAVKVDEKIVQGSFEDLRNYMTKHVKSEMKETQMNEMLVRTAAMAKSEGVVISHGTSYGTLKNLVRKMEEDRPLSPHLDYGELEGPRKDWAEFLSTGIFMKPEPFDIPEDFQCDEIFYKALQDNIEKPENNGNWYAHYQLGVLHIYHHCYKKAKEELNRSLELRENPWAYHGLSVLALLADEKQEAKEQIIEGIKLMPENLAYIKEGFRILLMVEAYSDVCSLYKSIGKSVQEETRVQYDYLVALANTGKEKEAFEKLTAGAGFVLDDLREGLDTLSDLYEELYEKIYHEKPACIPHQFNFHSLEPVK